MGVKISDGVLRILHGEGWTPREIAKTFGLHERTVRRRLRMLGLPSNCRARREALRKEAVSLVQGGLTYKEAAKKLDVSPSAVRIWSLKAGVRSPKSRPHEHQPIDEPWTLRKLGNIVYLESPTYRRLREVWQRIGEAQELLETGAGDRLELAVRLQALEREERRLMEACNPIHRHLRILEA